MTNREKLIQVRGALNAALKYVDELLNTSSSQVKTTEFPNDPVAKSLSDMVTTKQLSMIKAVAREAGVDANKECSHIMNCRISELSKRAASAFIDYLRDLKPQNKY